MLELGDIFHLIKTYTLTFGLLLNPWLVFGVSSGGLVLLYTILLTVQRVPTQSSWYSACSQHFIYRLKLELEEDDVSKWSGSVSKPDLLFLPDLPLGVYALIFLGSYFY